MRSLFEKLAGSGVIGLAALLVAGAQLVAGPLNKLWVDRDAHWVGHVDVEAAMASTLGPSLEQGYKRASEYLRGDETAGVVFATGIDFLRDIRGATLYGFDPRSGDGVMLIDGTAAFDKLFEHLEKTIPGFGRVPDSELRTYAWMEGEKERYARVHSGAAEGERIVMVAHDLAQLERAVAVVNGEAPSLALAENPPLSEGPRAGSVLFIAADGLNLSGGGQQVAMLSRLTSAFSMDIGESGADMYAQVSLTARDDREAAAMVQIIHGMLAWAQIRAMDEPDLQPLAAVLADVAVEKAGRRITARVMAASALMREALSVPLNIPLMCDEERRSRERRAPAEEGESKVEEGGRGR